MSAIEEGEFKDTVINYLHAVDSSLETLSEGLEGKIPGLPSWVLGTREIILGVTEDSEGVVVRITPAEHLGEDLVTIETTRSAEEVSKIIAPMSFQGRLPNRDPNENNFLLFGDMSVVEMGNPLAVPVFDQRCLVGWGRRRGFFESFNIDKAKQKAIDLWNSAVKGVKGPSVIQEAMKVFEKFQAIAKRKAFLERRIHRFMNEYSGLLLPNHKKCLFEQALYLGDEKRKSDFILEREQGLPPMLIELESPVHDILTKRGDLTAPANHARQQISEWVSFIEGDPLRNASGENSFLTGPKERLVIIGRGLEHRQRLIQTKFDGVTFWTYSILIEEARNRWNTHIASQYKLLGLDPVSPF
jgi:hypothetical protein